VISDLRFWIERVVFINQKSILPLRDSAGLTPDFPHFAKAVSDAIIGPDLNTEAVICQTKYFLLNPSLLQPG
jgi:hypothetical protein